MAGSKMNKEGEIMIYRITGITSDNRSPILGSLAELHGSLTITIVHQAMQSHGPMNPETIWVIMVASQNEELSARLEEMCKTNEADIASTSFYYKSNANERPHLWRMTQSMNRIRDIPEVVLHHMSTVIKVGNAIADIARLFSNT